MAEVDIYSSVLDYMCENYDYSLYATDFNANGISSLKRSIASVSTTAGTNRIDATKVSLQDFFNAIFQKVFVYEDEDRLKIVKYFDKGALNEYQDRQLHALRQELIKYKDEVEETFSNNSIYMFDKSSRKRFEATLLSLDKIPLKEIIREQINIVYDLDCRDIVVFLNKKVFLKKFSYKEVIDEEFINDSDMLYDKRFIDSLWEEVKLHLNNTFNTGFDFLTYNSKEFHDKYPTKFLSILKKVLQESFSNIDEKDARKYSNIAFKHYKIKMLKEVAKSLFSKLLDANLRAVRFLKEYSESTKITNNKKRLNKAPLMNKKGKIYNYQSILSLLKERELLISKITHKKTEINNIQTRVSKSRHIVERSEDEMRRVQKRRMELLLAIEKVEDDINSFSIVNSSNNININRLEFSKRDLLEAFKQVEIRLRTQKNILNNTKKELLKWEEKGEKKKEVKDDFINKYIKIEKEYEQICEILAIALSKEPLVL